MVGRGLPDVKHEMSGNGGGRALRTRAALIGAFNRLVLDRRKREATLQRMQQIIHERAMFAPIWDFAFLHGVGPRVEESALGLLGAYGFSAPYEDVKLKAR